MDLPRCDERAGESRQLGAGDALGERRAAEWIRSQHLSNDAGQRRRSHRHRIRRKRRLKARLGRRSHSRRRTDGHPLRRNPNPDAPKRAAFSRNPKPEALKRAPFRLSLLEKRVSREKISEPKAQTGIRWEEAAESRRAHAPVSLACTGHRFHAAAFMDRNALEQT